MQFYGVIASSEDFVSGGVGFQGSAPRAVYIGSEDECDRMMSKMKRRQELTRRNARPGSLTLSDQIELNTSYSVRRVDVTVK